MPQAFLLAAFLCQEHGVPSSPEILCHLLRLSFIAKKASQTACVQSVKIAWEWCGYFVEEFQSQDSKPALP